MDIVKRIRGRIIGIVNDYKSRYWEYINYYYDGKIWKNVILFESYNGLNFQGNPYYLYKEYFSNKKYSQYEFYISIKDVDSLKKSLEKRNLLDNRVHIIKIHSSEYRKVLSHAKYLINNVSFNMDFIKKQEQVYLNTWHGTPLKALGRSIKNDPFECINAQRNFLLCDYLIAPNEFTKEVFEKDYMIENINSGKILLDGYPRNSIFYNKNMEKKVKEKYELNDYISILYMPTWRGTSIGINDVDQISDIQKIAEELGNRFKVFVKFHPAMLNQKKNFEYCYNIPGDIEIYEFLNAMDILITDYSSVFIDFANTGKKIILYQYDKESYFKDRGIYNDLDIKIKFPIVMNYQQLINEIKSLSNLNYKDFKNKFCKYDSVDKSKILSKILMKKSENKCSKTVDLYVIDYKISQQEIEYLKNNISSTNFRFVFIPKRSNRKFSDLKCFDQLSYFVVYTYSRLSFQERISYYGNRLIYKIFKNNNSLNKILLIAKREQRRLWGDTRIGDIYSKNNNLPVALQPFIKSWPKNL